MVFLSLICINELKKCLKEIDKLECDMWYLSCLFKIFLKFNRCVISKNFMKLVIFFLFYELMFFKFFLRFFFIWFLINL